MKASHFVFEQCVAHSALFGVTNEEVVRRLLRESVAAGRLLCFDGLAKPLLTLTGPLGVWRPNDPTPDFAAWAWKLESRWESLPLEPVRVFAATPRCIRILGGAIKWSKSQTQLSHDIHVGQVLLALLRTAPAIAAGWVHEDELEDTYEDDEPRPDAVIYAGRQPVCAIEFGGGYDKASLEKKHRGCAARNLPYELW
jgi:hypothetical protein